MEITIHTGCQGDTNTIHIDWFDHNNVHKSTLIEVNVLPQDKPRTLEVKLDGKLLATISAELPKDPDNVTVTPETVEIAVLKLLEKKDVIGAIKLYRNVMDSTLFDAKRAVDDIREQMYNKKIAKLESRMDAGLWQEPSQ